ncbi:MAG: MFS transporter [Firmicutes bacterium]|nr:MFS transporter [Bacillota bacterium]
MLTRSASRWLYIAPSIFMLWFLSNFDKLSISIFVTNHDFLSALHILNNPAAVGLILSIFVWPYGICNFFWGFMVDRYGPRRIAMVSILGWTLAMLVGGLAYSYGAIVASRLILALAESALWPVSLKLTSTWFPRPERARAQTTYFYGQVLGFLFGALVVTALLLSVGWRGAYFILAGLALVVALPMFLLLVRDAPSQHYATSPAEREYIGEADAALLVGKEVFRDWSATARGLSDWRFWLLTGTMLVSSVASFGLGGWLPSYLKTARHFPPTVMAFWVSAAWAVAAAVALLTSWLGDRSHRFSLLGIVGLVIATVVLWVTPTTQDPNVAAPLVALGLATALVPTYLTPGLLQEFYGARLQGRLGGLMMGISNLLSGFAPLVIGLLVASGKGSFSGAFTFLVAIIVAGMICYAILLPVEVRRNRLAAQAQEAQTAG